jgi:hypothetical protein
MLTMLTDIVTMLPLKLEPPKVLHKPPVVVIQSVTPRPKPRPLLFKFPGSDSMTPTPTPTTTTSDQCTPTAVKLALQSVLAMEMSPSSNNNNNNKSSSTPFLIPSGGGATKKRHLKPISASSTPTEPYITLEVYNNTKMEDENVKTPPPLSAFPILLLLRSDVKKLQSGNVF